MSKNIIDYSLILTWFDLPNRGPKVDCRLPLRVPFGVLGAIWPQNGSRERSGPRFSIFLLKFGFVLSWICCFSRSTMSAALSCWLLLAMCFIIVRPKVCPFNCDITVFFVAASFQLVVLQASGNLAVLSMLFSRSWSAHAIHLLFFGAGLPLQVPKSDLRVVLFGVFRHYRR